MAFTGGRDIELSEDEVLSKNEGLSEKEGLSEDEVLSEHQGLSEDERQELKLLEIKVQQALAVPKARWCEGAQADARNSAPQAVARKPREF